MWCLHLLDWRRELWRKEELDALYARQGEENPLNAEKEPLKSQVKGKVYFVG